MHLPLVAQVESTQSAGSVSVELQVWPAVGTARQRPSEAQ
jgi:hypothetical protein